MSSLRRYGRLLLGLALLIAFGLTAQAAERSCRIAINTPAVGAAVGRAGMADGTAEMPEGSFLWAYARIRGETEVWPQGGGPRALEEGGAWSVHTYYGVQADVGANFELILQVVGPNDNAKLAAWVNDSKNGSAAPIRMPTGVEGCPIVKVVVKKVSH